MENYKEPEKPDVRNARNQTWAVPDRLPTLSRGSHEPGSFEPCAMEAAAWLAGDAWSNAPKSVHPVIASVARWANDHVEERELPDLWPLILASVGTATRYHPILSWRLRVTAAKAQKAFRQDPIRAWDQVLARHRQLTAPAICIIAPPTIDRPPWP